jgi:hypothetical protein
MNRRNGKREFSGALPRLLDKYRDVLMSMDNARRKELKDKGLK